MKLAVIFDRREARSVEFMDVNFNEPIKFLDTPFNCGFI